MIYLIWGQDSYRLEKEIQDIITDDAELTIFEKGDIGELFSNLLTQSFFEKKRTFLIKELALGSEADEKKLRYSLENLPKDTTVIFVYSRLPARSKIQNIVKKYGTVKKFEPAENINLISFIKEKVAEEGGEIAPLAAERLASYVGSDLWQLSEEIRKLVLYRKNEMETEPIETSDVDLLVKANFEANIFALLDAIAAKNQRRASELLNSFLESGENEIYILTMIERQFKNIAMAKFERNITESSLAKKAGLHPFVAKKAVSQAKNFEEPEIIEIFRKIMDADLKLKSGYEPRQVLLRMLV